MPRLSLSGCGEALWKRKTPEVPKRAKPKNKSTKCGIFSVLENDHPKHRVYHASHHTFTIKKPRSAPSFFEKPLQKHAFAPD
jgi:hypothetical protein